MSFKKHLISILCAATALCSSLSFSAVSGSAYYYPEYYTGAKLDWNAGGYPNWYWGSVTGRCGFLWLDSYQDDYYIYKRYRAALGYYGDWIANNGCEVSITESVTTESSISSTVSSELGSSYSGISAKIGGSMTATTKCTFSTSLGLKYNLKDYPGCRSVRIASMGYIIDFDTPHFVNGAYQYSNHTFAYDEGLGKAVTLIYRNY